MDQGRSPDGEPLRHYRGENRQVKQEGEGSGRPDGGNPNGDFALKLLDKSDFRPTINVRAYILSANKDNPTIYTVAKQAGVSIATVSRVLTNSNKVRPATREKVLRTMEEMGYHPNVAARRLALQTSGTIAMLFPDLSGPYYSMVISGVDQEASRHDYTLLIYGTHEKTASAGRFMQLLASKVDGFIIMTRTLEEHHLAHLSRQRIPFVMLGLQHPTLHCDSVMVDNRGGAYNAVLHLAGHGHRRIAFIGGPEDSSAHHERLQGYQDAMQTAGLPVEPGLHVSGRFLYEGGRLAAEKLLSLADKPTAIFSANDEMAMGVLDIANSHGIKVPDQLAVVGFDDIQAAAYTRPPLTTMRQPMKRLGEVAAQLLLYRLSDRNAPLRHEVFSSQLIIRQSCGCQS